MRRVLAIECGPLVIECTPLAVLCKPFAVERTLLAVLCEAFAVECEARAIECKLPVIECKLRAVECKELALVIYRTKHDENRREWDGREMGSTKHSPVNARAERILRLFDKNRTFRLTRTHEHSMNLLSARRNSHRQSR